MSANRRARTLPSSITGVPDQTRRMDGYMFVENRKVAEDLVATSPIRPSRYVRTQRLGEEPREEPLSSSMTIPQHKKPVVDNSHLLALEAQKERKEREFPELLAKVDRAREFLGTIEKEMELADEAKRNKVRRQFEEWNTNVHGVIQKKIASQIDSMDKKALNRKKNQDYDKFLGITNRKAAIFRDIIIESEYDPLEPNRHCVKAKTSKLNDPPKFGLHKAEKEKGMLGAEHAPPKVPLGKNTLDVQLWASGQIEATPYGTFAKMMNKPTGSGGNSAQNPTQRSSVAFDHFSFPHGRAAIDKEMPRGKRVYPEVNYSDPGRIFGVLPPEVEREIAAIKPPENRRPF
eukprot:gene38851-47252_t